MPMTYSPFKVAKALRAASYHPEAADLEEAARQVHDAVGAASYARNVMDRAAARRCHQVAADKVQAGISMARRCGVI